MTVVVGISGSSRGPPIGRGASGTITCETRAGPALQNGLAGCEIGGLLRPHRDAAQLSSVRSRTALGQRIGVAGVAWPRRHSYERRPRPLPACERVARWKADREPGPQESGLLFFRQRELRGRAPPSSPSRAPLSCDRCRRSRGAASAASRVACARSARASPANGRTHRPSRADAACARPRPATPSPAG